MRIRLLNLGAGVQSTAVFLLAHEENPDLAKALDAIAPADDTLLIDHAIFADTQEEPRRVYDLIAAHNVFATPETTPPNPTRASAS